MQVATHRTLGRAIPWPRSSNPSQPTTSGRCLLAARVHFGAHSLCGLGLCATHAVMSPIDWSADPQPRPDTSAHSLAPESRLESRHRRTTHAGPLASPHKWLARAQPGHCGTTAYGEGSCTSGSRGSWKLSALGTETWVSAAAECLEHCAQCARCHVISVSVRHRDCSWYAACPATTTGARELGGAVLQSEPKGFRTAAAVAA